jgi:hypothetical protein
VIKLIKPRMIKLRAQGYVGTSEVAEKLGITPKTLRKYMKLGVFPEPDGGTTQASWMYSAAWVRRAKATMKRRLGR